MQSRGNFRLQVRCCRARRRHGVGIVEQNLALGSGRPAMEFWHHFLECSETLASYFPSLVCKMGLL